MTYSDRFRLRAWSKDKNGRLIYENDYLKIGDEIFRVFWNSFLQNGSKAVIVKRKSQLLIE
jgi:hypothetical protein